MLEVLDSLFFVSEEEAKAASMEASGGIRVLHITAMLKLEFCSEERTVCIHCIGALTSLHADA